MGYKSGETIPKGQYNTILFIGHRDKVLQDSGVGLDVPVAGNGKTEFDNLVNAINSIVNEKGDNYEEYYYPSTSLCYAYEPKVSEGRSLASKFKAHHWWMPGRKELHLYGESLALCLYKNESYGWESTVLAQATKDGFFKPYAYQSCYCCSIKDNNGRQLDDNIIISPYNTEKPYNWYSRNSFSTQSCTYPICKF